MSYNSYTDQDLLLLLKTDNHQAFQEIYNRYWDKLLYLAGKKIGDIYEAENVLQDVFLDLWKRRAEIQVSKSLKSYLAVAVKYRIINFMARQNRHRTIVTMMSSSVNSSFNAHDKVIFSELTEWLEENVAQLPDKCRLAYQLREVGLSQKQIAQKMTISEKTVEQHISKALRQLRIRLAQFVNFFL